MITIVHTLCSCCPKQDMSNHNHSLHHVPLVFVKDKALKCQREAAIVSSEGR